jgi:hypothetical protein
MYKLQNLKYFIVLIFLGLMSFKNINNNIQSATPTFSIPKDTINWKLLGKIEFVKKTHHSYGLVDFPIINDFLKKKNGKRIVMSGFIVPIDNVNYALSKNVFASCFFCGKAGPETIMGIQFKAGKIKLKTDQYVTLEGTFRVNDNNLEDWIYHIEDAIIVKGN